MSRIVNVAVYTDKGGLELVNRMQLIKICEGTKRRRELIGDVLVRPVASHGWRNPDIDRLVCGFDVFRQSRYAVLEGLDK